MKILQIINSHALHDGGAQRLALELHRAYRARGHEAHLLALMPSPTDETATYSLDFASPYRLAVWRRLLRFLRRFQDADVIHVHLFPAQLWVALAVRILRPRARLITTEHNTFNRRRATLLGRLCDRFTLRAYQKIICISDATREALEQWQPQSRTKLVTIPNGIDLTRFQGTTQAKTAGQIPIILSVGRIAPQKNYATALRAVAQLTNQNFRFQIAGQDELDGEMQRLARELGIESRIEFLGYQSDIPSLLGQADIFLMCSHWEGFGLAVAEAMVAGLPVVVPDVPGVREVVRNGETNEGISGILIDPNSPTSVAAALERLLEDADLRQNLSTKASERGALFDIQQTVGEHIHLYEQVCGVFPAARA